MGSNISARMLVRCPPPLFFLSSLVCRIRRRAWSTVTYTRYYGIVHESTGTNGQKRLRIVESRKDHQLVARFGAVVVFWQLDILTSFRLDIDSFVALPPRPNADAFPPNEEAKSYRICSFVVMVVHFRPLIHVLSFSPFGCLLSVVSCTLSVVFCGFR